MSRSLPRLAVAVVLLSLLTAVTRAETKTGSIRLQEATLAEAGTKVPKIEVGARVKAVCRYFIISDFFGRKVVSVQAQITNTAARELYYGYYVAFFDKDGELVAASSFAGGQICKLGPGKKTTVGNIIELPVDQMGRISSYQVTVLESDKEFGK